MSIFTVTITGTTTPREVYGGLTAALDYVRDMFSPAATAWLGLGTSEQGQTLTTATKYLDRLPWDGTATGLAGGTATTLQWARTGLTVDGVEVDSTIVPPDVVSAAFEMSVLISAKPGLVSQVDQGSNLRMVGGGGAPSVEFFAPTSAARGTATRLPVVIQQLVGKYLAEPSASLEGGLSGPGNTCSSFSSSRILTLSGPE